MASPSNFSPAGQQPAWKNAEGTGKEIHYARTHEENQCDHFKTHGGDKTLRRRQFWWTVSAIKTMNRACSFSAVSLCDQCHARKCPKFIIARIQENVGGGVGITAAADMPLRHHMLMLNWANWSWPLWWARQLNGRSVFPHLPRWPLMQQAGAMPTGQNERTRVSELHGKHRKYGWSGLPVRPINWRTPPETMMEMKKIFWAGTGQWDELLKERAAISGKLVLEILQKMRSQHFKTKQFYCYQQR